MIKSLIHIRKCQFGIREMKKAFYDFLNFEAGAVYRGAPEFRQRKYKHIEITDKFKELEKKRKAQRLTYIERRKELLQRKVNIESKLLTEPEKIELEQINKEQKSLKEMISESEKQLAEVEQSLSDTEAEHVVVEGIQKQAILNKIEYLQYVNKHPSGLVLNPESVAAIQNVHYLITHNLPVERFKIYEISPELFTEEISELDEAVVKLIEEKQLSMFEETSSSIKRWGAEQVRVRDPKQKAINKVTREKDELFYNISLRSVELMDRNLPLINDILAGKTPFRNFEHAYTCLISTKLNLKLTTEEEALKKDVLQVFDMAKVAFDNIHQKWHSYMEDYLQRIRQIALSYEEPAPYIKNHPVLLKRYDEYMERLSYSTAAADDPQFLPHIEPSDDGKAFMEGKIRAQIDQYDEEFQRLFNTDRELLIAKKNQMKVSFYNLSTKVLEEYQEKLQLEKEEAEDFKKLPKKKAKELQSHIRLHPDHISKMIYLNNKDPKRYDLEFFAKYFGYTQKLQKLHFKAMLNSLSFLRVHINSDEDGKEQDPTQQVLKFVG